jgi:hypothetical protein
MLLAVAKVTTLNEVLELAGTEATGRVAELEGPEEVGGLLEVGANGEDFMDEILHADDAVLAEVLLNDRIVGEGNALLVDLSVSALVHKLLDALEVGVTVGDPRLNNLNHLRGCLGHADKDTVVDLEKTEELEDLAGLGGNLVDTLDADEEDQLGLSRDVEGTILLGGTGETNLLTLTLAIFLDVGLGALEDGGALSLVVLLLLLNLGSTLSASLLLRLALLQKRLGDENVILGRDRPTEDTLVRGPAYQRYVVERRWRIAAQVRHSLVANSILTRIVTAKPAIIII